MKHTFLKMICVVAIFATVVQAQQSAAPANKWEAEIKKFEEADRKNAPAKDVVLFTGSSSIRLWQSLAQDFPQVKVLNRGFGGSEIADSTFYVDRMIVPYQPRMILLYAGDNDIANNKTPQKVFEDYKAFVSRVRQKLPITRIAFISIKPSPARASLLESMRQANEMIKDYVSHDQSLVYIDVFSPMLGVNGKPRPELFGPDNLHMNKEGYRLWKSVIAPYLR